MGLIENTGILYLEGRIIMAKYKSKIKDCQLIVKVKLSSKEKIDERALDFFAYKRIRGLLKARVINRLGGTSIEYSGPKGISLYERLKEPVERHDFYFIMEQIVNMFQKLRKNGLSPSHIIWDIQHVYMNDVTSERQFIYMPFEKTGNRTSLVEFVDQVIHSAVPVPNEDSKYITRFLYFLEGLDGFDAEQIERYIINEDKEVVDTIKARHTGQSGFMTDKPRDYYAHYSGDEEATTILKDEEGTTLLVGEDEGTVLLNGSRQENPPVLYRVSTEERICIQKSVFRIGTKRGDADYSVDNNHAVSRNHAEVIRRGERCFIMDLDSMNKTYINGQIIPARQETEIYDGDSLKLANEEFILYF